MANTKWFKENPEIAEKYTRTLIKAEKFLNEKPEESVKIFQKYMEMEEKDAKTLLLDTYQNFESDPNSDGVLAMWDTMCKIDYVENKDTDVKSHIDIATYKAAMDSIIAENPDDKFYSGLTERYENWNKEMLKQ